MGTANTEGYKIMHPKTLVNTLAGKSRRAALGHLLAGLLLLSLLPTAQAQAPQQAGTCARVEIQLSQDVAITRTAFRATLKIGNSPVNVPLQNLKVMLDIRDAKSNPANAAFGISDPVLTSISDVAGNGTIAPGAQATAVWTILPTRDAAPLADTKYTVGGTITYTLAGVNISLPLFPAPITVKPDPLLQFHYFLQRDVYGDDPFTPEVEPSEPFSLGLIVVNKGAGAAHNLSITSSQPKIVENEKGLQIAFQLLGASVNGQPVSPSLTAALGDIAPGKTSVADFLLLSSLQGKFLSYNAKFKHKDDLNNPRTSILDSVDTHFLEHVVRVVAPSDDGKPDFLTNETPNTDNLPDTLWNSVDGSTSAVTVLDSASDDTNPLPAFVTDGPVTNSNLVVHLTVPTTPSGFLYIRTDDPGRNIYQLAGVVRSDGKNITLGDDAWTTHRTIRLKGQAPYAQNRLYLFDDSSTGAYTLTYQAVAPIPPIVSLVNPHDGDTFSPNTTLTLGATATSIQAIIKELDFYDGSILIGTSLTAPFTAPYLPAAGPHTLLAVAIDANGAKGTSTSVNITVSSVATPPPTVRITSPSDGADLFAPATVTVSAAAAEPGGTVAKVDFYSNGVFLGSAVSAPYALTLENLPAGADILTAVATDTQNQATTSAPVSLQIEPSLTETSAAVLRVVSAVRQATPGQMMITVQNSGGTDAVNVALGVAHTKWGGKVPLSITPASVPMLTPNSSTTFMLQFPTSSTGTLVLLSGTYSGRSFGGVTRVTP